ncbi:hypothetical protein HX056_00910 [Myroides odoratimimus]|uniref:hypothetical protein n=1 Tax=Myroides odoratimimus TaxID=76832 RepID=UPI002575FC64|nr:hypothetical protein [Myroides odoratimimus]MDM1441898.1 hypothetical protein [Myroides odoratimimus]
MLVAGNIIYFDPFYFKNGSKAKAKYFLVVSIKDDNSIIASLPSSKDYVPAYASQDFGCCEIGEANFNCFIITPETTVTECGKNFELPTYLYGHLLDSHIKEDLLQKYPTEGVDYYIWGQMREDIFNQVVECFKNSDSVKRKYKRMI